MIIDACWKNGFLKCILSNISQSSCLKANWINSIGIWRVNIAAKMEWDFLVFYPNMKKTSFCINLMKMVIFVNLSISKVIYICIWLWRRSRNHWFLDIRHLLGSDVILLEWSCYKCEFTNWGLGEPSSILEKFKPQPKIERCFLCICK